MRYFLDASAKPGLAQLILERGGAPAGITVRGDLWLHRYPHAELPEGLSVSGNLRLRECERLQSLPRGLRVGADLILVDCLNLRELPADLVVGGHLHSRNTPLRRVPPSVRIDILREGGERIDPELLRREPDWSLAELLALRPSERGIAVDRMGWERFFARCRRYAQLLDADPNPRMGTLYRVRFPGYPELVHLLMVRCASLPRHYVLRVPPEITTARRANAWTWGLEKSGYLPEDES